MGGKETAEWRERGIERQLEEKQRTDLLSKIASWWTTAYRIGYYVKSCGTAISDPTHSQEEIEHLNIDLFLQPRQSNQFELYWPQLLLSHFHTSQVSNRGPRPPLLLLFFATMSGYYRSIA